MSNHGSALFQEKKLIDCSEKFKERQNTNELVYELVDKLKTDAERNALENADTITKKKIHELEVECMKKGAKIQNSIPTDMISMLLFTVCIVVFCVSLILFQITSNTKLIDYYILIFWLIAGIGLFRTSYKTISEWKRFLSNEEK